MPPDSALVRAIRAGRYGETRRAVLTSSAEGLRADSAAVRQLYRAVGAAAHGDTSPDGLWLGPSVDHYACATFAHMACIGVDRAARLGAVPRRVAADLPDLFPAGLDRVVETWSELFQRSPKNWDRVAHYPVMFEWVRTGLVEAPTADGAVNLLLQELSHHPRRYTTKEYGPLLTVTLPRLFVAAVRPSLGAAAIDYQLPPGDRRRVDELVLRLVRDGVWSASDVGGWVARGLEVRPAPFQRRWLLALRDRLPA